MLLSYCEYVWSQHLTFLCPFMNYFCSPQEKLMFLFECHIIPASAKTYLHQTGFLQSSGPLYCTAHHSTQYLAQNRHSKSARWMNGWWINMMFLVCRCAYRVTNFKTYHGLYKYPLEVVRNILFFFLFNFSNIKSYIEKIYLWRH